MKLDSVKFGLALGILWSSAVLLLGLMSGLLQWGTPLVKGIGSLYLGYKATAAGAIIGMIWAFIDGSIGGWLLAVIYNGLLGLEKKY